MSIQPQLVVKPVDYNYEQHMYKLAWQAEKLEDSEIMSARAEEARMKAVDALRAARQGK